MSEKPCAMIKGTLIFIQRGSHGENQVGLKDSRKILVMGYSMGLQYKLGRKHVKNGQNKER